MTRLKDLISAADIARHPELLHGRLQQTEIRCPECGGQLEMVIGRETFVACTECEFCKDIPRRTR